MKGVVGIRQQHQCRSICEQRNQRIQQVRLGIDIARALQKQHGHLHFQKMGGARIGGLLGRVQRKTQEREAAHLRQRIGGLRLRGHASAKGLAARKQRQRGQQCVRGSDGGADRGVATARADPAACRAFPCTGIGSAAWQFRARRKSVARFAMKGCCMPAPAPCATTKQALDSGGEVKSPETRVVAFDLDCSRAWNRRCSR